MSTSTSENENVKSLLDSDDIKVRTQGSSLYLDFNKNLFDIQILESEVEEALSYQAVVLSYPTGYTKDNCMVLSYKEFFYDTNDDLRVIRQEFGNYSTVSQSVFNTDLNYIDYMSNGIQITLNHNENIEGTFKIQIALMKIV